HAPSIGLALLRQGEHRGEQRLELKRRTDAHPKVELVLAGVPEAVGSAVENRDLGPRPELERLVGKLQAETARHDLELLHLERVEVSRSDEAARLHERVEQHSTAPVLVARLAKDQSLTGDAVLDSVSCVQFVHDTHARNRRLVSASPVKLNLPCTGSVRRLRQGARLVSELVRLRRRSTTRTDTRTRPAGP